jgi:hypothetical protein
MRKHKERAQGEGWGGCGGEGKECSCGEPNAPCVHQQRLTVPSRLRVACCYQNPASPTISLMIQHTMQQSTDGHTAHKTSHEQRHH